MSKECLAETRVSSNKVTMVLALTHENITDTQLILYITGKYDQGGSYRKGGGRTGEARRAQGID